MTTDFPIHICSLAAVKEMDTSIYDGIITIEDSNIENPFRVRSGETQQLILRFDDISTPIDDLIVPQDIHVERALKFAQLIDDGSLLIHCHAGISRSSAIALAIIAEKLGEGNEEEAVKTLEFINPNCRPNKLLVKMIDYILNRNMVLYNTVLNKVDLTY